MEIGCFPLIWIPWAASLLKGELSPCFGPIFGGCHQGPIASTGPVFNLVLGLRLGPAQLLFKTPSIRNFIYF